MWLWLSNNYNNNEHMHVIAFLWLYNSYNNNEHEVSRIHVSLFHSHLPYSCFIKLVHKSSWLVSFLLLDGWRNGPGNQLLLDLLVKEIGPINLRL
jgi:hypothetical protein